MHGVWPSNQWTGRHSNDGGEAGAGGKAGGGGGYTGSDLREREYLNWVERERKQGMKESSGKEEGGDRGRLGENEGG